MARPKALLLSQAEEDLIHDKSLECLKEIGVRIDSEPVLELLEKKGSSVDYEDHIAKISENMINEALEAAPKKIILYGRDPKNDLELPAPTYPYSAMSGCSIFIRDKDTDEYRDSTARDAADISKLTDGLDGIDIMWPAVSVTDMPAHAQTLYELWITLQNCSKHFQGDALHGAHNARAQIDMASLIVGGEEELKKRPIISMVACPLAPLSFEKGIIEAQVEFARAGVPIVCLSMSIGGLSAPVSVAGMMLNSNAENLASLVITQAAAPGAPHIYGAESSPMNMRTGCFNYDAPEFGLIYCGMSQLSRRYGLPSSTGGFGGFRVAGDQRETLLGAFSRCFASSSHTDIVNCLGDIDDAKGICFKQLLIDAYTWECCRKYFETIDITEEKLALDVMKQVGPRGTFLTHRHTFKHHRNELISWDQEKYDLLTMERDEQMEKAGELVTGILKEHRVTPLDESIVEKGYGIIEAYEQKYAERDV
jgi:trimethylamine--corrinoid protein Co-methyltransferase